MYYFSYLKHKVKQSFKKIQKVGML